MTQDRMPLIPDEQMTPTQRAAMEELTSGPRGKIRGPFVPLIRSPELMSRLQKVGEYLRFHNTVGYANSEFAVLLVARQWSNPIEWSIHKPIAQKEGVSDDTIQAIAEGRRPAQMTADQAILYDALTELRLNQSVSDATYARVVERFGEQGVIDMVAHYGYYSLLAMVMNTCRTALPEGAVCDLPPLPA